MPVFCIRSSSSNIYQIAKITNVNIKTVKYPNYKLSGQYVPTRAPIQAILIANYTVIILLQPLGSIINFKNFVLTTKSPHVSVLELTKLITLGVLLIKLILNSTGSAFGKNTITLSSTSSNSGSESVVLISAANVIEWLMQK